MSFWLFQGWKWNLSWKLEILFRGREKVNISKIDIFDENGNMLEACSYSNVEPKIQNNVRKIDWENCKLSLQNLGECLIN